MSTLFCLMPFLILTGFWVYYSGIYDFGFVIDKQYLKMETSMAIGNEDIFTIGYDFFKLFSTFER